MRKFSLFVCAALLAGCTDLSAVREISSDLTKASSAWDDVAADLRGSCQREILLNPDIETCERAQKASEGVIAANKVLGAYFTALANLANDDSFSIQTGLDTATTSVSKIRDIDTDQVEAVSGLFGLLVDLAATHMQQEALSIAIEHGAPNATTIIEAMDKIVATPLQQRLQSEKTHMAALYTAKIRQQGDPVNAAPDSLCNASTASTFSGTGFLLVKDYCSHQLVIEAREKALAAYRASLADATEALTALTSSKADLDARDLAKQLFKIGFDLNDKISAVEKAFA